MSKTTIYLCLFVAFCALSQGPAWADSSLEWIPRGRPFRLTFADPREVRMALSLDGGDMLHASIGNYFSILGLKSDETAVEPWIVHFGLEGAGFFTMRQEGSRFPLETADGLIGLYIEGALGPWHAQFRYTHLSAHLADGSSEASRAYSRETASLRLGCNLNPYLHTYAGIHYLAHTIPVVPRSGFQAGGSWFVPVFVGKFSPFMATDIQWQGDALVNPSFSLQIGVALNNPPSAYDSFRLYYGYFTGSDPRGQFYDRPFTSHSFGIEMQI